jgi:hypothetical protein
MQIMNPIPNSRDVTFMSRGIARNMALDGLLLDRINAFNGPAGRFYVDPASFEAIPRGLGGGDANGTSATIFFGQSGTIGRRPGVPRQLGSGNDQFGGTPLVGSLPSVTSAPFMFQEFNALKSTVGNWGGGPPPVIYNFVWRRDGVIVGSGTATSNPLGCSFPVTAQDNGHSFTCTVIAVNGFGPGTSASNAVTVTGAV